MSKNISVKEGGTGKQMTVNKLKTDVVGGGTCLWVPEDETQLTTKSITENGVYKASDDDKYGYSQVSVHVSGGNGSADNEGKPTITGGINPGGIGSSVIGTDPESGNDIAVGVDENGNLVQTPVPSAIQIITPPTKTSYTYQEDMDYTGIVVSAKNKDGTTFTNDTYPNGHIPMQELIFSVDKAPAGTGDSEAGLDTEITGFPNPFAFTTGKRFGDVSQIGESFYYTAEDHYLTKLIISEDGLSFWYLAADSEPFITYAWGVIPTPEYESQSYTFNGKTVYYHVEVGNGSRGTIPSDINNYGTVEDGYYANFKLAAWAMVYGNITPGGTVDIPVGWVNPYTGATHQDTFEITSTSGGQTTDQGGFSGGESGF